jgi:hypothetical protein
MQKPDVVTHLMNHVAKSNACLRIEPSNLQNGATAQDYNEEKVVSGP